MRIPLEYVYLRDIETGDLVEVFSLDGMTREQQAEVVAKAEARQGDTLIMWTDRAKPLDLAEMKEHFAKREAGKRSRFLTAMPYVLGIAFLANLVLRQLG